MVPLVIVATILALVLVIVIWVVAFLEFRVLVIRDPFHTLLVTRLPPAPVNEDIPTRPSTASERAQEAQTSTQGHGDVVTRQDLDSRSPAQIYLDNYIAQYNTRQSASLHRREPLDHEGSRTPY